MSKFRQTSCMLLPFSFFFGGGGAEIKQNLILEVVRFLCHLFLCQIFVSIVQTFQHFRFFLGGGGADNELFWGVIKFFLFKDVRVHAPITCIKLGIPIYFIDHSEFITVQCKKRANNEIKCFEFSSVTRASRPHLRTIIAIKILIYRFASPYGKT